MRTLLLLASLSSLAFSANVTLSVWVPDGVTPSQEKLAASVAGVKAEILSVQGPQDDLILLLITDLTGEQALVDTARAAILERINTLEPNQLVGLMRSQDGLKVHADPSADRAVLATAIKAVPVEGKAALLNTIETATKLGDSVGKSGVRIAVLYITDSDVANYREDYTNPVVNSSDNRDLSRRFSDSLIKERISRLVRSVRATETPVFVVHLNYRTDSLNDAYQSGLIELASATGGQAWFSRSRGEIPGLIQSAFSRIQNLYSVKITLPAAAPRESDIALSSGSGEALQYRSRYVVAHP